MSNTATYILVLHSPTDLALDVGMIGVCDFPGGFYAYIGVVNNSERLVAQLKKHLGPISTPRNDIDFLQQAMSLEEIWLSPNHNPSRNDWVDLLLDIPGSMSLIEGFGGADLDSDYESYLLYFDVRPTLEDFAVGFRHLFPNDTIIRAFTRNDEEVAEASNT